MFLPKVWNAAQHHPVQTRGSLQYAGTTVMLVHMWVCQFPSQMRQQTPSHPFFWM